MLHSRKLGDFVFAGGKQLQKSSNKIAVIGAGIVGVSTAIWLQRLGQEVTLIDREGIAAGASYGNAGILACSGIIPVSTPDLLFKAPRMLLDPNQPLFLRWSYLPKLAPWLVKFFKKANHSDMNKITSNLYRVMYDSVDQHIALAKGTGAEKYIKNSGWLHGYAHKSDFEKDRVYWEIRKNMGLDLVEMEPEDIADYDLSLKGKFGYAVRSLTDGHITDPGAYINQLAEYFKTKGGQILIGEVVDIPGTENKAKTIEFADGGEIYADHFVITSGAWSAKLTKMLGLNVPLETERGYHLEFVNANVHLKSPLMVTAGKFGVNSMDGRLRCAGIVELGGIEVEPSRAPFELLMKHVRNIFPELEYDEVKEWMRHRPSTPDSLPLIGALDKLDNVWAGFGHQHLGLTGGPKTGRWLAQMISDEKPNEDLSAFDPNRF